MTPRTGTTAPFAEQLALVVQELEALVGVVPSPRPSATPELPALIARLHRIAQALTPTTSQPQPGRPRQHPRQQPRRPADRPTPTHRAPQPTGQAHRRAGRAGRA